MGKQGWMSGERKNRLGGWEMPLNPGELCSTMTWRGPSFDKGALRPTVASGRAEPWTRTLNLGYVLSSQKVTSPLALTFTSQAPIFTPGSPPLVAHLALPTWELTWLSAPGSPPGPPHLGAHLALQSLLHHVLTTPTLDSLDLILPLDSHSPNPLTSPLLPPFLFLLPYLSPVPDPIPPPRVIYTLLQHVLKWWGWARLMLRRSL